MKNSRDRFFSLMIAAGLVLFSGSVCFAQDKAAPVNNETKKQSAHNDTKKVLTITEPREIYQISVDELLKSDAAKEFKAGNYTKALAEFQSLAKLYPNDITIKRYIGICYDRLGKYRDAIDAYNDALMLFPYHVPTHFYKALSFFHAGDKEKGLNELKFVADADPEGPYGQRAKEITSQVMAGQPIAPPKPKPWAFYGRYGFMYDDNVVLAPKDKALRAPNTTRAADRHELEGTMVYQLFETPQNRVTGEYGFSDSFNDHSLAEFNFHVQRAALEDDFFTEVFGKQILNSVRHDFSVGWLDTRPFSIANNTTASATTSFFERTRSTTYFHFGYTKFGGGGDLPLANILSRDGYYGGAGANTTLFTNSELTQWVTLGYAWDWASTQGKDFDMFSNAIQGSIHTPLVEKFYADFSAGYQFVQYPNFNGLIFARTAHRRDNAFVMSAYLSRPITKHLTWRAFYRWFDTQDRNAIFAFRRDIAGTEINVQI